MCGFLWLALTWTQGESNKEAVNYYASPAHCWPVAARIMFWLPELAALGVGARVLPSSVVWPLSGCIFSFTPKF